MTCTVRRLVHASVLLDFGGAHILTDPWFSQRPGYLHGEPIAAANPADLPTLSSVVISHSHYDHRDLGAFTAGRSATGCFSNSTEIVPSTTNKPLAMSRPTPPSMSCPQASRSRYKRRASGVIITAVDSDGVLSPNVFGQSSRCRHDSREELA